jgi:hypothetical protein
MPANYEDDDQPMAGGRERLGDRRFQPCAWLPQARSYLRNADPVLARLSNDGSGEASQSTSGTSSGAYPKNDNYVGRIVDENSYHWTRHKDYGTRTPAAQSAGNPDLRLGCSSRIPLAPASPSPISRQTDRYHAITQTTRHLGHADLLRDPIDSAVTLRLSGTMELCGPGPFQVDIADLQAAQLAAAHAGDHHQPQVQSQGRAVCRPWR